MNKNKLYQKLASCNQFIKNIMHNIFVYICCTLPIKRTKIVFDNFGGKGYGCNPKYIAEEIIRRKLPYDLVWISDNIQDEMPQEIRKVKIYSLRSYYEYATAKIWIDNIRNNKKTPKRKKQYYIQTWHSSLGLKKVEAAAHGLKEIYIDIAKKDAKDTDLMFANNAFRAKQYTESFWYSGKVIKCGAPRNAILFKNNLSAEEKIKKLFAIEKDVHLILYAPTFRSRNMDNDIYKFDYKKILDTCQDVFGNKYTLLLRLHPNVAKNSEEFTFDDDVVNASYYPDMQELLAASDILITDYSSCMFDASFANKPVFIYAKDIEKYISDDQGLLMDLYTLPYSISKNSDELESNIYKFSELRYNEMCKEFFENINLKEDGNGDEKIVEIIKNVIEGKKNE